MTNPRVDRHSPATRQPFLERMHGLAFPAWPVLAAVGFVAGVVVSHLVFDPHRMRFVATLPFMPLAAITGYATARVWWHAVSRQAWRQPGPRGLCIQGALVGGLAVSVAGVYLIGDPPLYYLDALMPGLFVGLAIARCGCLVSGCCAGRPSDARWALWSYSRSDGARRVPTQPMESLLCLGIAAAALSLQAPAAGTGAVFVGALAAYALGRQALLPLRDQRREPSPTQPWALAVSAVVLGGDLVVIALH